MSKNLYRSCPICTLSKTQFIGEKFSKYSDRSFSFGKCTICGLGLVLDPRFDFHNIYDENYYRGLGADPLVNYFLMLKAIFDALSSLDLRSQLLTWGLNGGGYGLMSEQGQEHL